MWDHRLAAGHSNSMKREGGGAMITYSELFQFSLVIIGIISLCVTIMRKK